MSAPVLWFMAGVALFGCELISPLFMLMFFGLGAWAAGAAALLGADTAMAFGVFSVVSVGSLLLLRRTLVRVFSGRSRVAPEVGDGSHFLHTGKTGVLTRPVGPGLTGEMTFEGSYWRVTCEQALPEGTEVRIVGHQPNDEITLRVEPTQPVSQ